MKEHERRHMSAQEHFFEKKDNKRASSTWSENPSTKELKEHGRDNMKRKNKMMIFLCCGRNYSIIFECAKYVRGPPYRLRVCVSYTGLIAVLPRDLAFVHMLGMWQCDGAVPFWLWHFVSFCIWTLWRNLWVVLLATRKCSKSKTRGWRSGQLRSRLASPSLGATSVKDGGDLTLASRPSLWTRFGQLKAYSSISDRAVRYFSVCRIPPRREMIVSDDSPNNPAFVNMSRAISQWNWIDREDQNAGTTICWNRFTRIGWNMGS